MEILAWPDKKISEKFPNGADWTVALDDEDEIASCSAEVINGFVIIDDPSETSFVGPIQTVWVSAGERGYAVVRCRIVTTGGSILEQDYGFVICE